jgi:hypothetical protein
VEKVVPQLVLFVLSDFNGARSSTVFEIVSFESLQRNIGNEFLQYRFTAGPIDALAEESG